MADKIKTPFLMVLSGQEDVICNKAAKSFYDNSEVVDKTYIMYEDANHVPNWDASMWPMLAQDIIGFQDLHL